MTRILISGAGGFVGHHLVEYILRTTDWQVVLPLRRPGSYRRLDHLLREFPDRIEVHSCDIELSEWLGRIPFPDYIVHLAAKTSIADSIAAPVPCVYTNVGGTLTMLEYARKAPDLKRFLYFSTDEVFGPTSFPDGHFSEWAGYHSHSPYAATKAASEELCLAWASAYNVPVVITHAQNLIGERQSPEKFLPAVVRAALLGEKVNIYVDGKTHRQPMRNFLHARDAASAVLFLLKEVLYVPQKLNITSSREFSNLGITQVVGRILGKNIQWNEIEASTVRPGFYVDHGLSGKLMDTLGWQPLKSLADNLTDTVHWMVAKENLHWIGL